MRCVPRAFLVAALFTYGFMTAGTAAETPKKYFNVAPDVAERSLKMFSVQSGREVLFATETAGGVKTNPVKGDYTPQEAADRLLAGTGLIAVPNTRSEAFTVGRAPDPNGQRTARTLTRDRP